MARPSKAVERQAWILEYIRAYGFFPTDAEVMAACGCSERTVYRDFNDIRHNGDVAGAITKFVMERAAKRYAADEHYEITRYDDGKERVRVRGPSSSDADIALKAARDVRAMTQPEPSDTNYRDFLKEVAGHRDVIDRSDIRELVEAEMRDDEENAE